MPSKSTGEVKDVWISAGKGTLIRKTKRSGTYPNYYLEHSETDPMLGLIAKKEDTRSQISYTNGMGAFNSCTHYKCIPYHFCGGKLGRHYETYDVSGFPLYWVNTGMNWGTVEGKNISFQGCKSPPGLLEQGSLPSPDFAELVYQVGQQLDGRMVCSQNLLVDICQMLQVVRMLKDPLMLKSIARGKSLPLSKVMKLPANWWLEYKFGWKPLYQDVVAIANVWKEVRQHQAYLRDSVDKYVSCASRQTVYNDNPSCGTIPSLGWGSAGTLYLSPRMKRVKAEYAFSLDLRRTAVMTAWSKFDQVISRLGFTDVAEALWDCVPFSFVVDWFTHINRDISRKSINWGQFDLRRIGWSRKTIWEGYINVANTTSLHNGRTFSDGFDTSPQIVQIKYERFPGFPSGTSSVGLFGNLSKAQIASGIALIVQRI